MPITGIEGDIGAGKTGIAAWLMYQEWKKFKKPIISNFHLYGMPFRYVTLDDIMEMVEEEIETPNTVWGLDELHILADSRLSSSKKNRLFSYFALQTGKEDINAYWTSQDFMQVDTRIRKQTRYAIHVRRKGDLHLLTIRHMMRPDIRIPDAVVWGPEFYNLYDTREKIRIHRPGSPASEPEPGRMIA